MPSKIQYQYETSPRKIDTPIKKRKIIHKNNKEILIKKAEQQRIEKRKKEIVAMFYVFVVFAIVFVIGYRNAMIDENFMKVEKLKTQLSEIKKENEQLEVNIENSLNLSNVEEIARDVLGMRKLDNNQKVYINLPKREYIEPANEKVIVEEPSWFDGIIKIIKNLW